MKAGAVTHARGNSDYGTGYQSSHHARQRALHSRANYNHPRFGESRAIVHQPEDTGHADIVDRLDLVAHDFSSDLRLLRDGDVTGAGAYHDDFALAVGIAIAPHAQRAR